jgi:hypothetical protein
MSNQIFYGRFFPSLYLPVDAIYLVTLLAVIAIPFSLIYAYFCLNDANLAHKLPNVMRAFFQGRLAVEGVKEASRKLQRRPIMVGDSIPPRTSRKYIIAGEVGLYFFVTILQ